MLGNWLPNRVTAPYWSCHEWRIALRRLAAIGHAVVADDANAAMASSPAATAFSSYIRLDLIFPGDEEQQLAGIVDALEDLLIDYPVAAGLRL